MNNKNQTIKSNQRFELAPDTLFQTLENESILVNLKTETIFGLNETGSLIAGYISEEKSLAEMIEALDNIYLVAIEELRHETTETLKTLLNHNLIQRK